MKKLRLTAILLLLLCLLAPVALASDAVPCYWKLERIETETHAVSGRYGDTSAETSVVPMSDMDEFAAIDALRGKHSFDVTVNRASDGSCVRAAYTLSGMSALIPGAASTRMTVSASTQGDLEDIYVYAMAKREGSMIARYRDSGTWIRLVSFPRLSVPGAERRVSFFVTELNGVARAEASYVYVAVPGYILVDVNGDIVLYDSQNVEVKRIPKSVKDVLPALTSGSDETAFAAEPQSDGSIIVSVLPNSGLSTEELVDLIHTVDHEESVKPAATTPDTETTPAPLPAPADSVSILTQTLLRFVPQEGMGSLLLAPNAALSDEVLGALLGTVQGRGVDYAALQSDVTSGNVEIVVEDAPTPSPMTLEQLQKLVAETQDEAASEETIPSYIDAAIDPAQAAVLYYTEDGVQAIALAPDASVNTDQLAELIHKLNQAESMAETYEKLFSIPASELGLIGDASTMITVDSDEEGGASVSVYAMKDSSLLLLSDGNVDSLLNRLDQLNIELSATPTPVPDGVYTDESGAKVLYQNGSVSSESGLVEQDGVWYVLRDGKIDESATGLVQDEQGDWHYVSGGVLDPDFSGFVDTPDGRFYVSGGKVASDMNGEVSDGDSSVWLVDGKITETPTPTPVPTPTPTPTPIPDGVYTDASGAKVLYQNGSVSSENGLVEQDGVWYVLKDGKIDESATGLVQDEQGDWHYVSGGVLDPDFSGFVDTPDGRFYVSGGKVASDMNGEVSDGDSSVWLVDGKITETPTPEPTSTPIPDGVYTDESGAKILYQNGSVSSESGLVEQDGVWYVLRDGKIDESTTGLVQDEQGDWHYVSDGVLDPDFSGFVDTPDGRFYVSGGKVATDMNGEVADGDSSVWLVDGKITETPTPTPVPTPTPIPNGVYTDESGAKVLYQDGSVSSESGLVEQDGVWYVLKDGKIDESATGLVQDEQGDWHYVSGGVLDPDFSGFITTPDGRFYVSGGKIAGDMNGEVADGDSTVWLVGGKVTETPTPEPTSTPIPDGVYTDESGAKVLYQNGSASSESGLVEQDGVWYVLKDGKIDESATGLVQDEQGNWHYVSGGVLDPDFSGFVDTPDGRFYVSGGKVATDMNGEVSDGDSSVWLVDGRITETPTPEPAGIASAIAGNLFWIIPLIILLIIIVIVVLRKKSK